MSRTQAGRGDEWEGRGGGAEEVPRLHLITDGATLTRDGFVPVALEVAEALAASGRGSGGETGRGSKRSSAAFHLRGPGLSGRDLWELGRRLLGPLQAAGLRFLVNDRADLARALGADGVHLAGRSLPAFWVREWLGPDALLGRSIHDPDDADPDNARSGGAVAPDPAGRKERASLDYLMVGTLWATASHPGRPGAGIERLLQVRSILQEAEADPVLPVIGIGGVTLHRVAEVLEGGGYGVAVKGGVWEASDPAAAAVRFRDRLQDPLRDGWVEGARMRDEPGGDG